MVARAESLSALEQVLTKVCLKGYTKADFKTGVQNGYYNWAIAHTTWTGLFGVNCLKLNSLSPKAQTIFSRMTIQFAVKDKDVISASVLDALAFCFSAPNSEVTFNESDSTYNYDLFYHFDEDFRM